jgi:hypothetical protein
MILAAVYQLHQIFTNIVNGILRQGQKQIFFPFVYGRENYVGNAGRRETRVDRRTWKCRACF